MKKLMVFMIGALILAASPARADFTSAAAGCIGVGAVAGGAAYVASRGYVGGSVMMAGAGCVAGGSLVGAATVHAEEAPSEMELNADDLKTLQDAQDLKNE